MHSACLQALSLLQHQHACGAPLAIAVLGAKGAGKSTFIRLLANRLLAASPCVAFLDTDCGQPELTPPGMVSLHALCEPRAGPSHAHPRVPLHAHFLVSRGYTILPYVCMHLTVS